MSKSMNPELVLYVDTSNNRTPDEGWHVNRVPGHHYCMQADFALEELGNGPGECLIIGSPLHEAFEFVQAGWSVTYVDVRMPPIPQGMRFIRGDAATMEFEPGFYDAASSTCVLCHAGMGRYGDPVIEHADQRILENIASALKHGARAAVSFGPVISASANLRVDNCHRVYSLDVAEDMARGAGFVILEQKILDHKTGEWKDGPPTSLEIGRDYLSILLEKP